MQNPLIVMSAITGKPDYEQISNYMKMLKSNGISQAMLYPRAGCELEYLSDEWFETLTNFINMAEQLDMKLWLYDEFNFPSGNANGKVTGIDEYCLKYIYISGDDIGKVVYAESNKGHVFGKKNFPNLICDEAVDLFINETHERYYEKFGKYFGSIIKGIFTDEPGLSYWKPENAVPYCKEIVEDYKTIYGRDFMEDVYSGYENLYEYVTRIIAERFNKCYISKIANWCREHGVVMTGHLMEDNDPVGSTRQSGNLLKNLSSFGMPGIDEIRTNFRFETLFNLFGVIEYARGDNGAMAELFALGPCDMSFAKKKCMLYFAACHKVNYYFLAISHMDLRGNMKIKNYFNVFTDDQPNFAGTRLLAEEATIAAKYADKDYVPDVYVRYPTEICTRNIGKGIELKPYIDLINKLVYNQVQWKFLDTDEDGKNIPVIEFTDDFKYVYNDEIYTDADKLCKEIGNTKLVKPLDNDTPEGFFVRKFNDGSFLILNIFAESGFYNVLGKKMWIEEHAVVTSEDVEGYVSDLPKTNMEAKFDINYLNDNMMRAMYVNSQTKAVICCKDDTEVVFAVRSGVKAYLDGKEIACTKVNNSKLSTGFKNLYGTSDKVLLKKGTYILESDEDIKHMPSVFVIGDFSVTLKSDDVCGLILEKRNKTANIGDNFADFGVVEFTAKVDVPDNVKAIEINRAELYTSIYINNQLIGEKICYPYIFDVDSSMWNKEVDIKIVQHSSIAPVFGDLKYYDEVLLNREGGTHAVHPDYKTMFGFEKINWIY
ncbi:MAG: hypothetical protein IKV86_07465 [Clostridia bacterium]|nr:hypothetical protein [Clostridia bacterium]